MHLCMYKVERGVINRIVYRIVNCNGNDSSSNSIMVEIEKKKKKVKGKKIAHSQTL